jgi:hypothetical protein
MDVLLFLINKYIAMGNEICKNAMDAFDLYTRFLAIDISKNPYNLAGSCKKKECPDCDGVIGLCMMHGTGCDKNPCIGVLLVANSINSGSPIGTFAMGIHSKTKSNLAESIKYFNTAMNMRFYAAARELALLMMDGVIPYDHNEVVRLLKCALKLGDPLAKSYLRDVEDRNAFITKCRLQDTIQKEEEKKRISAYELHIKTYCSQQ